MENIASIYLLGQFFLAFIDVEGKKLLNAVCQKESAVSLSIQHRLLLGIQHKHDTDYIRKLTEGAENVRAQLPDRLLYRKCNFFGH